MNNMKHKILSLLVLLLTAATSAWAQGDKPANPVISGETEFYDEVTVTITCTSANTDIYYTVGGTAPDDDTPEDIEYKKPITLTETTTIKAAGYNGKAWSDVVEVKFTKLTGPKVTLNEAKTEATLESMPTSDLTVDYELVRDMSVQMQAQVGNDPAKQPRYRVQWNDEKKTFVPADMDYEQVMALFSVNDLIEEQTLAPKNYFVSIYAIDDEGNPTGEAMGFTNFTFAPGRYCVTASALLDAPYDSTTAPSNIFELFQGYELKIAAGEYATYYKDENLCVEDADVKLYTITSVGDTSATLSSEITVTPANMPILVFNGGQEAKTILLIPTVNEADNVQAATAFKGTLTETTIPASDASSTNYAFNGKQFVWVKDAVTVAANRAWLEIPAANAARTIDLVFGDGETTSLPQPLLKERSLVDAWYTLDGRKLDKMPTKKGVYLFNGKKVVVK